MAGVMIDNKATLGGDIGVSTYGTMPDRSHQGRGYWKEARVYRQYSNYVFIGNNLLAHFPGQVAEGRPRAGTSLRRAVVRILCIPVLTGSFRVARVAGVDVTFENVTANGGRHFISQLLHMFDPETNSTSLHL